MNPEVSSSPKPLIVVLDDEDDILQLLKDHLTDQGFRVSTYSKPSEFMASIKKTTPDLILLDLMLPGENGLDLCRQIRKDQKTASIPVIFLTAKGDEIDRVLGFEIGADDYVTKPFSPRELIGRIKAVLRRSEKQAVNEGNLQLVGTRLRIDLSQYKAFIDGAEVEMTTTEFRILSILAENPTWVFSRQQILEKLWGHDKFVIDRTVDVHIRHLREKLGDAGSLIKNIRGIGYKIEP